MTEISEESVHIWFCYCWKSLGMFLFIKTKNINVLTLMEHATVTWKISARALGILEGWMCTLPWETGDLAPLFNAKFSWSITSSQSRETFIRYTWSACHKLKIKYTILLHTIIYYILNRDKLIQIFSLNVKKLQTEFSDFLLRGELVNTNNKPGQQKQSAFVKVLK